MGVADFDDAIVPLLLRGIVVEWIIAQPQRAV